MPLATQVERGRRMLAAGALVAVVGIVLAGTTGPQLGGWLVVVGWGVTIAGLHFFGRAGAG